VLGEPAVVEIGDAETELAKADHRVDSTYSTPPQNHNAIELHVATAIWDGDALVVHDATQMITSTAASLARVFGLRAEQVRVLSPFVGGGFGGKGLWSHQILAAAAAKLAGRPVRLVLSREGVYRLIGGRTPTVQRVALGVDAKARLTALIHSGVAAMTSHNNCPEQFTFPARHLYAAKSFRLEQKIANLDMLANTFMRAPGESVGTFALESAIDELAHEMGIDPIELRQRWEPDRDPTSNAAFSSRHLMKAYADGAARFGWERRNSLPGPARARRDGEWLVGMGVATATYPYYRMPGAKARLRIDGDGRITVLTAAQEMGMGTATVQAQHAADRLGVRLEDVSFEYGDSL
jgi:xanthine dehydrogenase YagR molybdenum-binding subunit